jgi:hypothetical protein
VPIDSAALPDDVALLKRIIADMAREAIMAKAEIDKLKAQIARLKRLQFGRSSEKLAATIAQLELLLDDLEEERGESETGTAAPSIGAAREKPVRRPLPDHLPREDVLHGPQEFLQQSVFLHRILCESAGPVGSISGTSRASTAGPMKPTNGPAGHRRGAALLPCPLRCR